MRKFLSLLLATAMLIIPTSAFANEEYGVDTYATVVNPVFDADFSNFATDGTISDKISPAYNVVVNNLAKTDGKSEIIGENTINYVNFSGTGTNDKFGNIKVDSTIPATFSDMTVEIWTKPNISNAATDEKVLFSFAKGAKGNSTFDASIKETETAKELTLRLNATNEIKADVTAYMGAWTHFVFVRSFDSENSTATLKIFANGTELATQTFESTVKADETEKILRISTYGDTSRQAKYAYRGAVSEVRLYNSALESANISRNYLTQGAKYTAPTTPDPGPEQPVTPPTPDQPSTGEKELLFDMDVLGTDLSDIKDVSGNNIAISTQGNVSIDTFEGGEGTVNYVKVDNNSGAQYISFKDSSLFNQSETTIEFYMKKVTESYPHPFIIGSAISNASFGYEMCFGNPNNSNQWYNQFAVYVGAKGSTIASSGGLEAAVSTSGGAINGGDWTHVVVTRALDTTANTASYKIYFNGEIYLSASKTSEAVKDKADTYAYHFGSISGNDHVNNGYDGGYADIKVYKGLFSAEDVKESFESNMARYAPVVLTNDTTFDRNTSALSFNLNGVDLSNGYTFSFADANDADKTLEASATKTDAGFDVTFNQYFKYGQKIQFTLSTTDSSGNVLKTFAAKEVSKGNSEVETTVMGSNGVVAKPDGSNSYVVDVTAKNNGSEPIGYKYAFIAKDDNGAAVACKSGTFTVSANSEHSEFDVLENATNAKEIRVYVWEVKSGMLVPVYGLPIILK